MQVAIRSQGSKYSKDVKQELIATYYVIGNVKKTAKQLGIPEKTAWEWVNSDWGESLLAVLHDEHAPELDANYRKIIKKANAELLDRLDNGDEVLDKANEIIRLKISGKSLATIGAICFDKRQILNNMPTNISTSMDNAALNKLQQQFQQLSRQSKVIEGEVITDDKE